MPRPMGTPLQDDILYSDYAAFNIQIKSTMSRPIVTPLQDAILHSAARHLYSAERPQKHV